MSTDHPSMSSDQPAMATSQPMTDLLEWNTFEASMTRTIPDLCTHEARLAKLAYYVCASMILRLVDQAQNADDLEAVFLSIFAEVDTFMKSEVAHARDE